MGQRVCRLDYSLKHHTGAGSRGILFAATSTEGFVHVALELHVDHALVYFMHETTAQQRTIYHSKGSRETTQSRLECCVNIVQCEACLPRVHFSPVVLSRSCW